MGRVKGGFTLMELLIVIVIISILASLVLVAVHAALMSSKETSTQSMINSMAGALESYRSVYGDYPPSDLGRLGFSPPNPTNNGIEALVACLSTTKNSGPYFKPPQEGLYTNTDGDSAPRNVTQWFFGDNQLREISDFFGQTLYYIHHSDFDRPSAGLTQVVMRRGEKPVQAGPEKSPATGTWGNHGRYQIISAGRDGKFGTKDDIRSW